MKDHLQPGPPLKQHELLGGSPSSEIQANDLPLLLNSEFPRVGASAPSKTDRRSASLMYMDIDGQQAGALAGDMHLGLEVENA